MKKSELEQCLSIALKRAALWSNERDNNTRLVEDVRVLKAGLEHRDGVITAMRERILQLKSSNEELRGSIPGFDTSAAVSLNIDSKEA